jgi:hypothetical protein
MAGIGAYPPMLTRSKFGRGWPHFGHCQTRARTFQENEERAFNLNAIWLKHLYKRVELPNRGILI